MAKKINYSSRNFADMREDLINLVRQYYPEVLSDFNDASIGAMLIDLNAAIGDNLNFHADRMLQETQIDYAQERRSVLAMARTFGLKVPGKRPSITVVDWSVNVPVYGDSFDINYCPIIWKGSQVTGAGKVFETVDDIDFSSPFTTGGLPNRLVIPNIDNNGNIKNYTLTKREIVLNGTSKIYKRNIYPEDVKPFFEVILPDNDVLSIENVVMLEGTDYARNPTTSEFLDPELKWYEVSALAEDKVFVEDIYTTSDNAGIKAGRHVSVNNRFITEKTDNGFTKVIFGGGSQDIDSVNANGINSGIMARIGDFINNLSLGNTVPANYTLFIQYRTGGGANTNIGVNTLKTLGLVDIFVGGPDNSVNNTVRNSLKVNNPIPCMGGKDEPSIEEVRNLVRYNFSAQNRCVTLNDYRAVIGKMDGKFGVPFRYNVYEEQNKVKVAILSLDENSKLTVNSTSTLKDNIAEYLSDFRMLNDYVEVGNGNIINIGFEVDLFIDKAYSQSQIISSVISEIQSYCDINNKFMGQNIYLSNLIETINNVAGVLNVIDLRVYNKVGGVYSLTEISQPYVSDDTRQIDISEQYALFADPISMFEVKYPEKDIKVRVKS